jgi:hypothetical protein
MDDATPLLFTFFFLVLGVLLGIAGKVMTASAEENSGQTAGSAGASLPPEAATVKVAENIATASAEPSATKDCKSCGGHSQAGRLCSFCGRAL